MATCKLHIQSGANMTYQVAALYGFANIEDPNTMAISLKQDCEKYNIIGTLILANEGINGTIAAKEKNDLNDFIEQAKEKYDIFKKLYQLKYSESSKKPFNRTKVLVKKEIVTLGCDNVDPNEKVGQYLNSQEWNELLSDPNLILIDTRNDYEYEIGSFKGAINPQIKSFKEFPSYIDKNFNQAKNKKIAMFCTGGIRCEKSTSLLINMGFENVYHLKGGILKYLEEVNKNDSLWEGSCFVFDERTAVGHGLEETNHSYCRACRWPLNENDRQNPNYQEGISCHKCYEKLSEKKKKACEERQKQIMLCNKKNKIHIGAKYKKG